MKLSLYTGEVKDGEFVPNASPVATAVTSPRGIVTSGDASYFEDFDLAGDDAQQRATLQEISDTFDRASYVKVTLEEGLEKRIVPHRLLRR